MNENMRIAGELADLAREISASGNEYRDISRGLSSLSKSFRNQGGRFTKSPDKDFSRTVSKSLGDLGKSFGKMRKSGLTGRQVSLVREAKRVLRMASRLMTADERIEETNYTGEVKYRYRDFEYDLLVANASFEIGDNGYITWYGGTVKGGTWHNGEWHGGTWQGGIWENGEWLDGTWKDGYWRDGTWIKGVWKGGTWEKGRDESGAKHDDAPGEDLWGTAPAPAPTSPAPASPAPASPAPASPAPAPGSAEETGETTEGIADDGERLKELTDKVLRAMGMVDSEGRLKNVKRYSGKLQDKINRRKKKLEQKLEETVSSLREAKEGYQALRGQWIVEKDKGDAKDMARMGELKTKLKAYLEYIGRLQEQRDTIRIQLENNEKYFRKLSKVMQKRFKGEDATSRRRKQNGDSSGRHSGTLLEESNSYWGRFADDEGDDLAGSCRVDDVSVAKELTRIASMLLADEKEEKSSMNELTTDLKGDLKNFNSVGGKTMKMLDKDAPSTPFNKMRVKEVLDALNDTMKD